MASNSTQKCRDESNYINILLLGESGTGKSTFINSFANYLQHSSLIDAEEELAAAKLSCLIPAKFTALTDDGDVRVINFPKDDNEDKQFGNSSTKAARAYVFNFEDRMIRLIDTPGINDSREPVEKDRENFENILDYMGQFEHLHAVCFILKPDQTVLTAAFKYCLVELLSRLDRSAAANIMFLFTRTRSTNYKAPESLNCIRRVLEEVYAVEGVTIPLKFKDNEHRNCFFFDNEGFNYLVAKQQGVLLGDEERLRESWDVSYLSSLALITYITGDAEHPPLPPLNVQDTVSISKARVLIFELSKPLADISQLVQDNLEALQRHQESIQKQNLTAAQLKELLYVPVINLVETQLVQPVTVCGAAKCAKVYSVAGIQKYHYTQRCHNPCYLQGVQRNIVGDPRLMRCTAMCGTTQCHVCGCNFSTHLHVYYETRATASRILDMTAMSQLATNEEILKQKGVIVRVLNERVQGFRDEHKEIVKTLATFAYYLQKNSICPINDAYEAYLDCLIENESMGFGDGNMLKRYESLKREHQEQKRLLEEAGKIAIQKDIKHVTSNQIMEVWERLKKLPHTGKKVDTLHRLLLDRQKAEMGEHMEVVHFPDTKKSTRNASRKDDGLEDVKISINACIGKGELNTAIGLMGEFIEKVKRTRNFLQKSCSKIITSIRKDRINNTKSMVKCLVKDGMMKSAILLVWNYLEHEDNACAMEDVYNWFVKMFACAAPNERAGHQYASQISDQRPQPYGVNQYHHPFTPFPNLPSHNEFEMYRNILDSFGHVMGYQQSPGLPNQANSISQQSSQLSPQQAANWSPFAPMQIVYNMYDYLQKQLGSQQHRQPSVHDKEADNYHQNQNSRAFHANQAPTSMQAGRSVPSRQLAQPPSQFHNFNEPMPMHREQDTNEFLKLIAKLTQPSAEAQSTYNNVGAQQAMSSWQLAQVAGASRQEPSCLNFQEQHKAEGLQNDQQTARGYSGPNNLGYQTTAAVKGGFLKNRFETLQYKSDEDENEIGYKNSNNLSDFNYACDRFAASSLDSQTPADNEPIDQTRHGKLSKSQKRKQRKAARQQNGFPTN